MNSSSEIMCSISVNPSPQKFRRPWQTPLLIVATLTMATIVAVAAWGVAFITLFRARRFYAEFIAAWLGKAILRICGIRLAVHQNQPFPESQTVYISNHTSTLDVFILLALALPNTRFFMWGGTRKWPPVALIGILIGIFFTPPQSRRFDRVKCFQAADRILRRTGESVYLSPEGARITSGEIGSFNKGAFHLATSLKAPIVPLYIDIPPEINPGLGLVPLPGTVHVHKMPTFSTAEWKLDQLEDNKETMRKQYLEFSRTLRTPECS